MREGSPSATERPLAAPRKVQRGRIRATICGSEELAGPAIDYGERTFRPRPLSLFTVQLLSTFGVIGIILVARIPSRCPNASLRRCFSGGCCLICLIRRHGGGFALGNFHVMSISSKQGQFGRLTVVAVGEGEWEVGARPAFLYRNDPRSYSHAWRSRVGLRCRPLRLGAPPLPTAGRAAKYGRLGSDRLRRGAGFFVSDISSPPSARLDCFSTGQQWAGERWARMQYFVSLRREW